MDAILRAAAVYAVLLVLFRLSGRRTLSELSSFDFILLLVVGEATQQALLGEDFSITNGCLVVLTLLGIDVFLSWVKQSSGFAHRWLEGQPTVILVDGAPLKDRMRRARVDEADILAAARELRGIGRLDQIKYAILERNGGITIIQSDGEKG